MTPHALPQTLAFPLLAPPKAGEVVEVRPGIFWARLALPFRLDHVNLYLLEDGAGWAVIDTGIGDEHTREMWQALLARLGHRLTRVIVTHFHPDHVGMAGWLCETTGRAPRHEPDRISVRAHWRSISIPQQLEAEPYRSFYLNHGLPEDVTAEMLGERQRYLRMVTGLPRTFRRRSGGAARDRRPAVRRAVRAAATRPSRSCSTAEPTSSCWRPTR